MSFEQPEELRAVLYRLHAAGSAAWRTDPEAADLMRYAADRFAALAHKHGLDPWEAAAAAFDAMRAPSTRRAEDPWAVVTRAVQVTCVAEERARGLLCSVHRARRPYYSAFHDAERFSDRETALADYHPALHAPAPTDDHGDASEVVSACESAVSLFVVAGWPPDTSRAGVEFVCTRLTESPSRSSAYNSLRRDHAAPVLLDLPPNAWRAMLRALLGVPDPAMEKTRAGRGILLRLLIGEPLTMLLGDSELVGGLVDNTPLARA